MVTFLSPEVQVVEIDRTNVTPIVGTSAGGTVISSQWGPVLENVLVDTTNNLVSIFGAPTGDNFESMFTAINFLKYTGALNTVRVVGSDAANASSIAVETFDGDAVEADFTLSYSPTSINDITVTVDGVLQVPTTDFTLTGAVITFQAGSIPAVGTGNISVAEKTAINNEAAWDASSNLPASVYAKYPGTYGNNIRVILADSTSYSNLSAGDQSLFNSAPSAGELQFAVIDVTGNITGSAGTVLEKKQYLTTTPGTKFDNGETSYYIEWINRSSQWVWVQNTTNFSSTGSFTLVNGTDDYNITDGEIQAGFDLFAAADQIDISLVMTGPYNATVSSYVITNIAEVRKDCVVFCSPERADVLNNVGSEADDVITHRTALGSSSYAVLDSGWKLQYDGYNDTNRWVPLNGDIAGVCAATDQVADPWFSPAGLNRGLIKDTIRLAYEPSKTDRDKLYPNSINPVFTVQGQGVFLYGDRTLLNRPSAFDRINVRRLFISLQKTISEAAQYVLFEQNNEFTRTRFKNIVEPYLRDVQGREGITDFRVVADATNNTDQVISENRFVADIFIKPTRSINFIQLNFIATRDGVSFTEIAG